MSGREDSNLRPPEPHSGALAKLRHAPCTLPPLNSRSCSRFNSKLAPAKSQPTKKPPISGKARCWRETTVELAGHAIIPLISRALSLPCLPLHAACFAICGGSITSLARGAGLGHRLRLGLFDELAGDAFHFFLDANELLLQQADSGPRRVPFLLQTRVAHHGQGFLMLEGGLLGRPGRARSGRSLAGV